MEKIPFLNKKGSGWELVVDGKPFVVLGGEIHNSSASSLEYMEDKVWDAVKQLNCNAIIAPIYWELFEPEEGKFDFSLLDGLIYQARERNLKLILLWFGTWKNSFSTYVPEWVKTDVKRFFRMESPEGKKTPRISYFCEEAMNADAKAFTVFMKRLKKIDGDQHTVIMVQIENEVGVYGYDRDYSSIANENFYNSVSEELINILIERKAKLRPELLKEWKAAGNKESGSWTEVFGDASEEVFSSWYFARFMEKIAADGKAEYALPIFVNAWLVQYEGHAAGLYPSGGPVSKMIDIWQIGAPTICLTAPDIYVDDFAGVCASYTSEDNPLMIPEVRRDETAAANVFYAIGRHHALCFSPFGIESMVTNSKVEIAGNAVADASFDICNYDNGAMLAKSYSILQSMMPLITKYYGTDKLTGILQSSGIMKETVRLGGYDLEINFSKPFEKGKTPGAGLFLANGEGDYFIAGHGFMIQSYSKNGRKNENVEISRLEEGHFENGTWKVYRRLNGDESWCVMPETPAVRYLKVFSFA